MPILLIEIDQIDVDESLGLGAHRGQNPSHAIGVVLRLDVAANASAEKYVVDLADAEDRMAGLAELVEQHAGGWRDGIVVAVRCSLKSAGAADEGSRDNAAHFSRAISQILYNSGSGITCSCAATWKTLSAEV